jgi:hypothetical protein
MWAHVVWKIDTRAPEENHNTSAGSTAEGSGFDFQQGEPIRLFLTAPRPNMETI